MRIFSSTTKTTFRRKSRGGRRLFAVLICGVVVLLLLWVLGKPVSVLVSYAGEPVYALRNWFVSSTSRIPQYLRGQHALLTERDALKEELASREADAARIVTLRAENEALRGLLGTASSRIAAGVIARPSATPYDTFVLDRGARDGVLPGALVFAHGDVAVGRIARVYPESALVTLFSTPGVRSVAYVFGPNIFTVAEGQGGGVLRVGIPQGVTLALGDAVVLPTWATAIVGTVEYVESDESNPEQYGFVTLDADLSGVRFVAVDSRTFVEWSYEEAVAVVEGIRAHMSTSTLPSEFATSTPVTET